MRRKVVDKVRVAEIGIAAASRQCSMKGADVMGGETVEKFAVAHNCGTRLHRASPSGERVAFDPVPSVGRR